MQSPEFGNDQIINSRKTNKNSNDNSDSKRPNRNAHRFSHTSQSAVKSLFGAPLTVYESSNTNED